MRASIEIVRPRPPFVDFTTCAAGLCRPVDAHESTLDRQRARSVGEHRDVRPSQCRQLAAASADDPGEQHQGGELRAQDVPRRRDEAPHRSEVGSGVLPPPAGGRLDLSGDVARHHLPGLGHPEHGPNGLVDGADGGDTGAIVLHPAEQPGDVTRCEVGQAGRSDGRSHVASEVTLIPGDCLRRAPERAQVPQPLGREAVDRVRRPGGELAAVDVGHERGERCSHAPARPLPDPADLVALTRGITVGDPQLILAWRSLAPAPTRWHDSTLPLTVGRRWEASSLRSGR